MPDILAVAAGGTVVGIDVSALSPDEAAAVRAAWVDAATDAEPHTTVAPVAVAGTAAMLSSLSQQVTMCAIDGARGSGWTLHAAGVATPSGDVVVLVGPSGRGKTSASRALGKHLAYVSDETIVIDPDGRVHPYRKPLSIVEVPGQHKVQVAPSALGLQPLPEAELHVRAIALLDRRHDHQGAPLVEPVDLAEALEELVQQSSFLTHHQAPLRQIASLVSTTGGVHRLVYREAADLVGEVARLAAGGAVTSASRSHFAVVARPSSEAAHSTPMVSAVADGDLVEGARDVRFSQRPVADAVLLGEPERLALLTVDGDGHGTVHVLAGVGPVIWGAARAATLRELTEAAIAAHGHPEDSDAETAVGGAVAEMLERGLLVSDQSVPSGRT